MNAIVMNLPTPAVHQEANQTFAELQAEMQRVLASEHFRKSSRTNCLLTFLVEQAKRGVPGAANEYAIGIEVFGRDAAVYSTGEDPIVRVQMGRLRARLAEYYLGEGRNGSRWRIEIPLGSYVPRLLRRAPQPARLVFQGLRCIARGQTIDAFTHGLGEELRYRLYRELGGQLAFVAPGEDSPEQLRELGIGFVLEGSVRQDEGNTRTTFRLMDLAESRTVWSEQVDHAGDLSLGRQESLANSCCKALNGMLSST